jgi:hypothetical protein
VKAVLLRGELFIFKTASSASVATSSFGHAVGSPRTNDRFRQAVPKRDDDQGRGLSAVLDAFQRLTSDIQSPQFDIGQVDYPLSGKTASRSASKPFCQGYFRMLLLGSSSARILRPGVQCGSWLSSV